MAQAGTDERAARQSELAWRRDRLAAALSAVQSTLEPGSLVTRATRRLQWRDLRSASALIGRTLCENPIATLTAAGSLAWLAIRSRAVLQDQSFRADLVLVPDQESAEASANLHPLHTHRLSREPADPRGRDATEPQQIPRRGWKEILLRTWREVRQDNISIIAAGVAFYALLAIFPALGAALAIYGFVADPHTINQHLNVLTGVLPSDARSVLERQLSSLVMQPKAALSFGALFAIALALWSASSGVKSLMTALNIAYEEEEKRGFLHYNALALAMTFGAIIAALIALTLVAVLPPLLQALPLPNWLHWVLSLARWPILALGVITELAVLYRYGPSRNEARWNWVTWGAVAATVLWIIASALFSWYAANFANYNKTYGSVGAIVVLLMWFYITAFVILLGAELNAEMERQTTADTTRAPWKPMGSRGARMADTVAD
jgi:membrane protein